ncbi:MAG: FAD-binding oxidoreductase [Candidatus Aminicenantes bacterium]|nr:FAD-binding oxidoreductase [Candidatus Aminicenantes bacterium]
MTLPRTAEVAIIGGGVIGASTAYHLARRGARGVVLLEREALFGMGSTSKCAGGVRYHFGTDINVRLSLLSLPAFERFEDETGFSADFRKCGYLFVLTSEHDLALFRGLAERLGRLSIRSELWTEADVRSRLPMMAWPDAVGALWGPDDGLADNGAVVQGYISGAGRLGALCLSGIEVTGLLISGGRVEGVETTAGTVAVPSVVNAAGAWAGLVGRMAGLEIPVVPSRRQVVVTAPLPEIPADFPFVIDFSQALYFHREGPALMTGMSNPGQTPGFDESVDEGWELGHLLAAAARMPLLERAGIVRRWAGLYELTPDRHPILGPVEALRGFYCGAGFSGHGFMHSPAAGLLLAEVILDGRARSLDISPLRLERFSRGEFLTEAVVV